MQASACLAGLRRRQRITGSSSNDLAGQLAGKLRELQKDGRKGSRNTQIVPIEKDRVWSKNSNRLKRHKFQGEIAERT
jgi:hypothetical protein